VTGVSLSNPGAVGMGGSSLEERVLHVLDRSAKRRTGGWLSPAIVVAFAMILAATMNALPQLVTYRVGDEGVAAPQVLKRVMPRYPEEAKDRRVEGMVVLETIVDGHGVPTNIEVRRSLDPALDRAAIEAASQWLFVPAKKDGKPVSIVVTLEFRFTLR
jgi:TonB family protein